ncbi:MAG: TSUP family transporter [Polaromonas sp.]
MGLTSGAAIVLAGWLIGATGIGGVLVVPALTQLEGLDVQRAIAAAQLAFAFPGAAALWWLRRGPPTSNTGLGALVAGAVPGAVLGATLVHHVEPRWLLAAVAALALVSGLRGLRPAPAAAPPGPALSMPAMAALGMAVGLGSALTGTGGPVLLVPLLMLWHQPLARTLAAAQAIQLPVALCASAAHWVSSPPDVRLACLLGAILLAGSLTGQWAAQRMNVRGLQQLMCLLLLATGSWFAWLALPLT